MLFMLLRAVDVVIALLLLESSADTVEPMECILLSGSDLSWSWADDMSAG
jgi:hypothetical protein